MRYSNPKISEKYSYKMRLCVTHMTCKKPPRYFCPVRGGICFFICRVLYLGKNSYAITRTRVTPEIARSFSAVSSVIAASVSSTV